MAVTISGSHRSDVDRTERVVLDLTPVQDGRSLEADGFIQVTARERLLRLLNEPKPRPAEAVSSKPELLTVQSTRSHDAIFINARRGEGKTTFLTRILRDLDEQPGDSGARLYSLGIIDPTLIETKQHIVIVVIDRLKLAVDNASKISAPAASDRYERFQQSLKKLAPGLAMLEGIGGKDFYGEDWLDSEFVLSQGLTDARAASGFEVEFQKCIALARECMEVDSFVLAVDDVDTWFERGWPVLEAVRKYLTSPYLQIVLSGDLDIYNLLVRSKQWAQMGDSFLETERWFDERRNGPEQMRSIRSKVDELQDQYLIKVIRPERRIDLQPLTAFHGQLYIRLDQAEAPLSAGEFVARYCRRLLATESRQAVDAILDLLLRLPVRSALQVMISGARLVQSTEGGPSPDARREALDGLRYVAWTDLMQLGLSPEETRSISPRMLTPLLARWFSQSKQWRDLPRFAPEAADTRVDLPALFGAAFVTTTFGNEPSRMIDYLLRISTVRELVDGGELHGDRLDELIEHIGLNKVEDSIQTVSRLAAWESSLGRTVRQGIYLSMASVPIDRVRERQVAAWDLYGVNEPANFLVPRLIEMVVDGPGTLPAVLRRFHETLSDGGWIYRERGFGSFEGVFVNSIAGLRSRVSPNAELVLAAPTFEIVSGQSKQQGGYSFLRLLSVIGGLLGLADSQTSADERNGAVWAYLSQLALKRSYPTPSAVTESDGPEDDDDDAGSDEEDDVPSLDPAGDGFTLGATIEALTEWIEHWADVVPVVPPLVLSRIWARFTYAHRSIRRQLRHRESRYLGVLMHRSAVAFLHALLVETLRSADQAVSSNANNNPVTAPEPFVALLRDAYERERFEPETMRLFEALFTCPLWAFFLPRHTDLQWRRLANANETIIGFYDEIRERHGLRSSETFSRVEYGPIGEGGPQIVFDGLYDLLNTVQLQGNPRKRPNTRNSKTK